MLILAQFLRYVNSNLFNISLFTKQQYYVKIVLSYYIEGGVFMNKRIGLSGSELLEMVFSGLYDKYGMKKIPLDRVTSTEIIDRSNPLMTRIGIFRYYDLSKLEVKNRVWLLAIGRKFKCPGYCPYLNDIIAFEISSAITESNAVELFKGSVGRNFKNSLVVAMESGYVRSNLKGYFGSKVLDKIKHKDLIVCEAIKCAGFENIDGSVIYDRSAAYKKEAVDAFINAIASVLE